MRALLRQTRNTKKAILLNPQKNRQNNEKRRPELQFRTPKLFVPRFPDFLTKGTQTRVFLLIDRLAGLAARGEELLKSRSRVPGLAVFTLAASFVAASVATVPGFCCVRSHGTARLPGGIEKVNAENCVFKPWPAPLVPPI